MQQQPSNITKKLINSTETCVEDNLIGFVRAHTGLTLLKNKRIVIRDNVKKLCKKGQVTILSGGGSGHEPFAAGYVGKGMLTAAIAGSVFASPPAPSIYTAIQILATNNSGGTLILVANYTGDRLTFGQAMERAKAEGLKVEMVLVGEDCAVTQPNKATGRRGLCGMVLIQKVAGAMAENGSTLEEIVDVISMTAKRMGTIGICLNPCSLPGSGPMFTLPPDEIELGLGIHGEAGVKKIKFRNCGINSVIEKMVGHMTDSDSAAHLSVEKGDRVAVVLNNLGGLSQLEMNIMTKESLDYLAGTLGLRVERIYVGTFQTSLEMAGISLTIMLIDDVLLNALDAPCDASAWLQAGMGHVNSERKTNKELPEFELRSLSEIGRNEQPAVTFGADEAGVFSDIIHQCCTALEEQEQKLNLLDSGCGDGDCGTTLKYGAQALIRELESGMETVCPRDVFLQIGTLVAEHMGGVSGGLYSIFFTAASKALENGVTISNWCSALDLGIRAVMQYGGAEPGDRTMVDALHAAHGMLVAQVQVNSRPVAALTEALSASKEAAASTAAMKPRVGRASYVSLENLGQPDAGATAITILLQAILDGLIATH